MGFIFGIPSFIVYIGGIFLCIIGGASYFVGLFRKDKTTNDKNNIKTAEDALKFVNSAFETKIKFLEVQSAEQSVKIENQDKRILAIEQENKILREVLQGRDAMTQEFQKRGIQTMDTAIPEILELVKDTNRDVSMLCKSIDGLVKALNVQTTTTVITAPVQ